MELKNIQIKNFRSVKDETIKFDQNCLILLGKNEAGKSNILKAIASIFGKYIVTNKDKRKRIDNEVIEEYFVRAVFKLQEEDFLKVINKLKSKYTNTDKIIFKDGSTINNYVNKYWNEFLIRIDIKDSATPSFRHWTINNKVNEFAEPLFLNGNDITKDIGKPFNIETIIFTIIQELYNEEMFKCHFWQYEDNFLLPNSINIAKFIQNPVNCKALENIFVLCKREKINEEFENAKAEDGDYSNLLEQISIKTTNVFRKIWKDFNDTKIQLVPNGDEILIKVVNKTKYSFEDRSDGFKKFISILLMLSTQSRTNKISENDIIIIDEPDQSLYPTSAQYLRDELLEMSKKSKIIYATHSQYMIDSNCIERHLVVEKKDDITTTRKENNKSPFSNDELLRRAIGSSIFECIKPINIIFEGWLDKELFNKYCSFSKKHNDFKNYGVVYLGGISGVETLVQLLILANKKFIIIADSDETSKNKRIDFSKNYSEYKDSWISYNDFVENISTMEDFIIESYISEQITKKGYKDFIYDNDKNAIKNIEKVVNKDKDKKQEIKNELILNISKENIKNNYGVFIEKFKSKIELL